MTAVVLMASTPFAWVKCVQGMGHDHASGQSVQRISTEAHTGAVVYTAAFSRRMVTSAAYRYSPFCRPAGAATFKVLPETMTLRWAAFRRNGAELVITHKSWEQEKLC